MLCRQVVSVSCISVKPLPAIQRQLFYLSDTLPTGDLGHHGRNRITVGRLHVLQVLAEAFAPDFCVADLRPKLTACMVRYTELITGQEAPSCEKIHFSPVIGQLGVKVHFDKTASIIRLHRILLSFLRCRENIALEIKLLPDFQISLASAQNCCLK